MQQRNTVLSRMRETCVSPNGVGREEENGKREERGEPKRPGHHPQSLRLVSSGTLTSSMYVPSPAARCQSRPFFLLCHLNGNPLHSVSTTTPFLHPEPWAPSVSPCQLTFLSSPSPSSSSVTPPLSDQFSQNLPCSPHGTTPSVAPHCLLTKAR